MAPDVELPNPAADAQSAPQAVTAVRSSWSVTVATQYAGGSVRYYAVPVASDRTGSSFKVTGAPGVVADPAGASVSKSSYAVTVPEGVLSSAVGEFLTAYLTGAGEVDRYLAPDVNLTARLPRPCKAVAVQQVLAIEEAATAEKVPTDGTPAHILASVEARDATGRWPLAYEFGSAVFGPRWLGVAVLS